MASGPCDAVGGVVQVGVLAALFCGQAIVTAVAAALNVRDVVVRTRLVNAMTAFHFAESVIGKVVLVLICVVSVGILLAYFVLNKENVVAGELEAAKAACTAAETGKRKEKKKRGDGNGENLPLEEDSVSGCATAKKSTRVGLMPLATGGGTPLTLNASLQASLKISSGDAPAAAVAG
ncbi:MAG: hypothetical protein LBB38_00640, partial [Puniceicoccales bacterium]|nr:hypothetical protein [Puniceicoccales bacterium]